MAQKFSIPSFKDQFFENGKLKVDYYFLGALLIIIGIVIFKIPDLGLPCFWDEAWSYAPAVGKMYENGPSMLPDAIPPENSRGHPLFFYFLSGSWLTIFGNSMTSVHSFALVISVLTLLAMYQFGKKFFSPKIGLIAVAIFAIQRVFLAQSAMLLPEMLMALLTVLTLLNWFQDKRIWFAIFGSLLLLTKESGVAVIAAIGIWTLIEQFLVKKGKPLERDFLWKIAWIAVPIAAMGLFFVIQRIMLGWFLFPSHVSLIKTDWGTIRNKILLCYSFMFVRQGRWVLTSVLFAAILLVSKAFKWNDRIWVSLGTLLVPVAVLLFPHDDILVIPILFLIFVALVVARLWEKLPVERSQSHRLTWFLALYGVLYIAFCAYNFLSFRYLLMLMVPIFPVIFHWMSRAFEGGKVRTWFFYGILLLLTVFYWGQSHKLSPLADISVSYRDGLIVQRSVARYISKNYDRNTPIYHNGQYDWVLGNHYAGFLPKDSTFKHIKVHFKDEAELVIISNNAHDSVSHNPKYQDQLEHLQTFKQRWYQTDVYKRTLPPESPQPDSLGLGATPIPEVKSEGEEE